MFLFRFVKLVNFTSPPEDQPSLSIQSIVARNNRICIFTIVDKSGERGWEIGCLFFIDLHKLSLE